VLSEAEAAIMAIKTLGINITEAEAKLQEAETAFDLGNYVEAETLGHDAKNLAIQVNQTATQAQSEIGEAEAAVANAQNDERTVGLTEAQNLLDEAKTSYNNGNYSKAINLATQAIIRAEAAEVFLSDGTDSLLVYGILVAVLIIAVIAFWFFFIRSRKSVVREVEKKKRRIDIDRIFLVHKDLMPEEKQAVRFLAENNGEAFEADLYEHIKLPRTTTWRLVRRLARMGVIKRTKFRRQNLIRIKNKYTIKD
jgi:uncharacterized membrane protein